MSKRSDKFDRFLEVAILGLLKSSHPLVKPPSYKDIATMAGVIADGAVNESDFFEENELREASEGLGGEE